MLVLTLSLSLVQLLDTMRDKFEELEQEIASVKEVTTDPKIFEVGISVLCTYSWIHLWTHTEHTH